MSYLKKIRRTVCFLRIDGIHARRLRLVLRFHRDSGSQAEGGEAITTFPIRVQDHLDEYTSHDGRR